MALLIALTFFIGFTYEYQLALQGQPAWGMSAQTPIVTTISYVDTQMHSMVTTEIFDAYTITRTSLISSLTTSYSTATYVLIVSGGTSTTMMTATNAATISTTSTSTVIGLVTEPVLITSTSTAGTVTITKTFIDPSGKPTSLSVIFDPVISGAIVKGNLTSEGVGLVNQPVKICYAWPGYYSPTYNSPPGSREIMVTTDSKGAFTASGLVGAYQPYGVTLNYVMFDGDPEYLGCRFTLVGGSGPLSLLSVGGFMDDGNRIVYVEPLWYLLLFTGLGLAVFGIYKRR